MKNEHFVKMRKKRRKKMNLCWFWRTKRDKDEDYLTNSYEVGETEWEWEWERWGLSWDTGDITKVECLHEEKWLLDLEPGARK